MHTHFHVIRYFYHMEIHLTDIAEDTISMSPNQICLC